MSFLTVVTLSGTASTHFPVRCEMSTSASTTGTLGARQRALADLTAEAPSIEGEGVTITPVPLLADLSALQASLTGAVEYAAVVNFLADVSSMASSADVYSYPKSLVSSSGGASTGTISTITVVDVQSAVTIAATSASTVGWKIEAGIVEHQIGSTEMAATADSTIYLRADVLTEGAFVPVNGTFMDLVPANLVADVSTFAGTMEGPYLVARAALMVAEVIFDPRADDPDAIWVIGGGSIFGGALYFDPAAHMDTDGAFMTVEAVTLSEEELLLLSGEGAVPNQIYVIAGGSAMDGNISVIETGEGS